MSGESPTKTVRTSRKGTDLAVPEDFRPSG
jgi:hypothetical protein